MMTKWRVSLWHSDTRHDDVPDLVINVEAEDVLGAIKTALRFHVPPSAMVTRVQAQIKPTRIKVQPGDSAEDLTKSD